MSKIRGVPLRSLAFLVVAFLSVSPALQAADASEDSNEISALLAQVREDATFLQQDASAMESFARSKVSWESHTAMLVEMKQYVNKMVGTVTKLNEVRSTGSPSQQQAIDRFNFLLRELVKDIQLTIAHLNENRQNITSCVQTDPVYRNLLRANYELATKMAS